MKLVWFATFAVLLAGCSLLGARASTPVTVLLDFRNQAPSDRSLAAMRAEVLRIMGPSGLSFDWRSLDSVRVGDTFPDLIVVRFHGNCTSTDNDVFYGIYSPEAQAAALASTATDGRRVLPYSVVACDELKRFIAPLTRGSRSAEETFGCALGRVVAHEMYHIFADTVGHAQRGVARSAYRPGDLVAPAFRLERQETEALRTFARTLSDFATKGKE
jgi:hypothetical protein